MTSPAVKLLDYRQEWSGLVASRNPFAIVVMTHLKTLETLGDAGERQHWKLRLTRRLYEQGYRKADILQLFGLIDWMMELPEELQEGFLQEMYEYEEARKMPYVTSVERIGIKKGIQQGSLHTAREYLLEILKTRFQEVPISIVEGINRMEDVAALRSLGHQAVMAESLDEFLQLLP